jgi:CRISPR/Cas system-associated protein Cas5 (RAMP superfamily)
MDKVNKPAHYQGSIECISAIESSMSKESFRGYLKGNVLKYMWRYEKKNGVEDLEKAQWYLKRLIDSL